MEGETSASDAVLVPIPKKGDLTRCDNWRGISLLDVVGKVAARILQGRLQELAEEVLPESQCGFRKGRGCSDMIFTVRQQANEHKAKIFLVFIDLRKAYDSVPREALWVALGKLGVPDSLIEWIRSFHQGMKAAIRLDTAGGDQCRKWTEAGLRHGTSPLQFIRKFGCREMVSKNEERGRSRSLLTPQARWETSPEICEECT